MIGFNSEARSVPIQILCPGSCVKECLFSIGPMGLPIHALPRFSLPTLWLARCELRTRPRMRIEDGLHCSLLASVLT